MSPNSAFLLLIGGLLGVYCEFIWPGRVVPGVLGAAAAIAGACFVFRPPLQLPGLALVVCGALLLLCEIRVRSPFLLGALGTIALTAGFTLLFPRPRAITPALAIPVSVLFGIVSTWLARGAQLARRNKRSDLTSTYSR